MGKTANRSLDIELPFRTAERGSAPFRVVVRHPPRIFAATAFAFSRPIHPSALIMPQDLRIDHGVFPYLARNVVPIRGLGIKERLLH